MRTASRSASRTALRSAMAVVGPTVLWPLTLLLGVAMVGTACHRRPKPVEMPSPHSLVAPSEEELTAVHRQLKEQEQQEIAAFVARRGRPMQESNTGLYYDIYATNSKGAAIAYGDAVDMAYTLRLLNGTLLASSETEGLRRRVVGAQADEPGLTELLLKMRRGEKAFAILPARLAYGFSGDGGRIPPQATLLYDIEIKAVYIKNTKGANPATNSATAPTANGETANAANAATTAHVATHKVK